MKGLYAAGARVRLNESVGKPEREQQERDGPRNPLGGRKE